MSNPELNVGIAGATGLVGRTMLDILEERNFPVDNLKLYASARSTGRQVRWRDRDLTVQDIATSDFEGLDIVLFSAGGSVSKEYAPRVAAAGAIVVDNSSAWRSDPNVPLVVSEVNPEALDETPIGIVANPNCTTMVAMPVLKPLHDEAGLKAISVTSLQAASGAGQRGIDELRRQVLQGVDLNMDQRLGRAESVRTEPRVFPRLLADNVIPFRGNLVEEGRTDEELKLLYESRKILQIGGLAVDATCVSVPVDNGHSLSIAARFGAPITPERAEELLSTSAGLKLVDIPTPLEASGGDVILVGRIRRSQIIGDKGLLLFMCGDNLREGAALNAVQIAELLAKRLT